MCEYEKEINQEKGNQLSMNISSTYDSDYYYQRPDQTPINYSKFLNNRGFPISLERLMWERLGLYFEERNRYSFGQWDLGVRTPISFRLR